MIVGEPELETRTMLVHGPSFPITTSSVGAHQLECIDLPADIDLEDVRVETLAGVLEEFDRLRPLEVKRLQLGAVNEWQRHQIRVRLRPVGVHGVSHCRQ